MAKRNSKYIPDEQFEKLSDTEKEKVLQAEKQFVKEQKPDKTIKEYAKGNIYPTRRD